MFLKLNHRGDMADFIFQIRIFLLQKRCRICPCRINGSINPGSCDLIKMNAGTPGNDPISFGHIATHAILVVRPVSGQSDGDHIVIVIITDKIQDNNKLFILRLSKPTSQLLDKYDW